jgi:hypothetical protein
MEVSGTFHWSSGPKQTFPVNDLAGWRNYVRNLVLQTRGKVQYWEVWNEPPNGSDNKSPQDYAKIVVAAYEEVKAIDRKIQVGLATKSNFVSFLDQALAAGAAGHFDYIAIHPYELLDLLGLGWEPMFMRIVPTLRRMLAARDPARTNVPIWFTEVGTPVHPPLSQDDQADSLIKAYTLGIAQGVARIAWFEVIDGDSGPFGLIGANGQTRPSYLAYKTLVAQLGPNPRYFGWVLLNQEHYGFVFEGPHANLLIAWSRPKSNESLKFEAPVQVIDPATGSESTASSIQLTPRPVIVSGVSSKLVDEAYANRSRQFPWKGLAPSSNTISYAAATPNGLHVIEQLPVVAVGGEPAVDCSASAATRFAVDPSFLSYDRVPIQITALVRRVGPDSAGFNFKYESATGPKSAQGWYTVPPGDQWTKVSWTLTDAQFVGNWGFNFSFDSDSREHSKYILRNVTVTKQ